MKCSTNTPDISNADSSKDKFNVVPDTGTTVVIIFAKSEKEENNDIVQTNVPFEEVMVVQTPGKGINIDPPENFVEITTTTGNKAEASFKKHPSINKIELHPALQKTQNCLGARFGQKSCLPDSPK